MKISVIVPVYNAEKYLTACLDSILSQTYQDFELILVDDCSTDNSVALLEELLEQRKDVRLRLVKKERNQGAAAARNTGLDMASGRYIAFLDADDVWLPHRLEAGLRFMEEKKAGFVFSAYEFGDEQARGTGKIVHVPEKLTYRKALSRTVVFTTTTLFDTTLVPKELLRMPTVPSEDTATWWQILRNGHVAYGLDQVLAIYRRPAKSLSSNKLLALQRIWNLYRKQEKLGLFSSAFYFCFWALRATLRRI